ncbi:ATP-binding protein [Glycomyces sp. L485]|uniref:ATP-binding protein n=1 Tax=Glycomyces sp. L485 TaxID=2909235 RepID=UPI001F4ADCCE|nr:ATP-binding protein [Glycomyces sp. L485]MCH7230918.1 ATP-binding protein [Glycomyces sp. L485]
MPRRAASDQVRRYLKAPDSNAERAPILNFIGPSGFGKTTTLRQLDERFGHNQEPPRALVDCAKYTDDPIRDLLGEIKFQLGRRYPGYGRIPFRRLELALAVTRRRIDFDDQGRAYRALRSLRRQESRSRRRAVAEVGGGVLGDLFTMVALAPIALLRAPFEWIATTAISYFLSRPLARSRFQKWFGHRDRNLPDDPVDGLAELNRWAHDPDLHRNRDQFLIDAFLADLRDAYGHGRLSNPGWLSCVLLLDNADSEAGQAFLEHVAELRGQYEIAGLPAEAVTVVASSAEEIPQPAELYEVPAFTEADVVWLSTNLPESVDQKRLPKLIHLTTGYPAAAAALVDTACRRPETATGIDTLLTAPAADGEADRTVEDRMRAELVEILLSQPESSRFSREVLDAFITCSAARRQAEADWLVHSYADTSLVGPALLLQSGLWSEERKTAAHDLLRWLLLRRFAAREADEPDWKRVHGELRDWNREEDDLAGELYHALALGDLPTVAERLTERLADHGSETPWKDVLEAVTRAPRPNLVDDAASPYELQIDLARSIEDPLMPELAPVARLVAGLWLANSPTTGLERRALHRQIALDYQQIAPSSHRAAELFEESERHDRLAQDWR